MIRKIKDWQGWWDGLRTNITKTVGTTGISFLGTNGLEDIGIHGIGMNWKTAIGQFGVHIAFELFTYLKNKPDADIIVEQIDTAQIKRGS